MDEFFLALDDCLTAIEKVVGYVLKKVVFFFLILILLCLVASLVNAIVTPRIPRVSGLENAASRLGFQPTLDGLAEHINATIKPGMSREEVEQILGAIGTVRVKHDKIDEIDIERGIAARDYITLKIPDEISGFGQVPGTTITLIANYNAEGGLDCMNPLHLSDASPVYVCAP